jgi:hypothetical protein
VHERRERGVPAAAASRRARRGRDRGSTGDPRDARPAPRRGSAGTRATPRTDGTAGAGTAGAVTGPAPSPTVEDEEGNTARYGGGSLMGNLLDGTAAVLTPEGHPIPLNTFDIGNDAGKFDGTGRATGAFTDWTFTTLLISSASPPGWSTGRSASAWARCSPRS